MGLSTTYQRAHQYERAVRGSASLHPCVGVDGQGCPDGAMATGRSYDGLDPNAIWRPYSPKSKAKGDPYCHISDGIKQGKWRLRPEKDGSGHLLEQCNKCHQIQDRLVQERQGHTLPRREICGRIGCSKLHNTQGER